MGLRRFSEANTRRPPLLRASATRNGTTPLRRSPPIAASRLSAAISPNTTSPPGAMALYSNCATAQTSLVVRITSSSVVMPSRALVTPSSNIVRMPSSMAAR